MPCGGTALRRSLIAVASLALVTTACAPDPPAAVVGLIVDSCDPGIELGSGMVIAPGLALTAAHVVAGGDGITVDQQGRRSAGTIVAFDPDMDLAYVAFDSGPSAIPTVASAHVDAGDTGTAYVVREGEVTHVPVRVRRSITLRTEDIYIQGETLRPAFELDADIRSGDSGGAVMIDGKVVAVISLSSNKYEARAYAIDAVRAADLIEQQRASGQLGPDVDITRCH